MRSDYCKLSWDAPEDDGGTAITQYTVAMMDLSVNQWVTAAETKDRSAGIQGLKPGHLYRYQLFDSRKSNRHARIILRFEVFAINKEGESPAAKLKDPVKAENPFTTPGVPTDVKIVDFDENSVTLRWKKPATDGGREISNYIIQKKDEFGGWFEALVTTDANCCATIAELEARVPGLR